MSPVKKRHVPETTDRPVIICALNIKDDRCNVTDYRIITLIRKGERIGLLKFSDAMWPLVRDYRTDGNRISSEDK